MRSRSCVRSGILPNMGAAFLFISIFFTNSYSYILSSNASWEREELYPCAVTSAYCLISFIGQNTVILTGTGIPEKTMNLPDGCVISQHEISLFGSYSAESHGTTEGSTGVGTFFGIAFGTGMYLPVPVEVDCNYGFSPGSGPATMSCMADFHCDNPPNPPPCSDPVVVSDPNCKGGKALNLQIRESLMEYTIDNLFPNGVNGEDFWHANPVIPPPSTDTLTRPDGSKCNMFNLGNGNTYDVFICPLGFEGEPSSSSSAENSSSGSGNGGDQSSGSGSGGDQSSGSGTGLGCSDLSNCDWAKLDTQLEQLGVEKQIRDKINDIAGLIENGYNLEQRQLTAIEGVIDAVNNSTGTITGAIGNGARDIVGAINGLADALGNGNGNDGTGIADGVADGLDKFSKDTAGQGGLDSLLGSFGFGVGGGEMGDSLGDGTGIRNRIKEAVGIDSARFAFLGTGGDCPVFDMTFNTGVLGIRHSGNINLCNVSGYNAASVLRAMMWLIVIVGCLFMNLHTLKTGGRS